MPEVRPQAGRDAGTPRPRRVAVLDDYTGVAPAMAGWGELPDDTSVCFFRDHLADAGALVERLAPFEIVVVMRERTRFDAALLARLPCLRLIATMGRRNAAIDLAAAARQGVLVAGTPGGGGAGVDMAGFTWALILALTRGLVREAGSVRSGGWQVGVGTSLEGRTLGILGFGRIGRAVARVGRAFGMDVVVWSRSLREGQEPIEGVRSVSRDMLLATSDVVTLHLVLSDETRGLIDAKALARMKPGAVLINTSRGPIVDEAALVRALSDDRIAGAALDTFDVEPLPADHPFRTLPNVFATPHIGFVTDAALRRGYRAMLDAILAYMSRRPVAIPLNRPE